MKNIEVLTVAKSFGVTKGLEQRIRLQDLVLHSRLAGALLRLHVGRHLRQIGQNLLRSLRLSSYCK